MKTKLNLLLVLFLVPAFLAAQCGDQSITNCSPLITLSPGMFSYPDNSGSDPSGTSSVGNLGDEQVTMFNIIGSNGVGTYPSNAWDDFTYTGIIDFGTEMTLSYIYISVAPNSFGNVSVTNGNYNDPDYDVNDLLAYASFPSLACPKVYRIYLDNVSTRYLTIDRIEGLESITEITFCGQVSPPEPLSISGCITTECGEAVPEVKVQLLEITEQGEVIESLQETNAEGCYNFTDLTSGSDYFIDLFKGDQADCGLNVYDRIAIQDHITGGTILDTPYKLLAADVNSDGVVDDLDYEQLSSMFINDGISSFTEVGGIDWKFVRSEFIFSDPTNPFDDDVLEGRKYLDFTASQSNQNFVGIKTGDAACSYTFACLDAGLHLSGCAATECGEAIPGAEVELVEVFFDGTISAVLTDYTTTNENGCYEFFRRTEGSDYIVTIAKADQMDCGIDEMDQRLIREHILFINRLTDPYDLLAADVDVDGDIDVTDVVLTDFLRIGDYESFLNWGGIPWNFVREGHIFSDPSNPFADLPLNSHSVFNTTANQSSLNFTGINAGDLNCSYDADCTTGDNPERGGDGEVGNDNGGGSEGGRRSRFNQQTNPLVHTMLASAQPNPFKETTNLNLELKEDGPVIIKIYDALGKEVFSENKNLNQGMHQISLDRMANTTSGMLTYLVQQNGHTISGKIIKLK